MKMKIYNAFGITPTNTYVSAGSDYYIPNLNTSRKQELARKAFEKSYNKTEDEINHLIDLFSVISGKELQNNIINLVHLFLALHDVELEDIKQNESIEKAVMHFLDNHVVYNPNNDVVGVRLFINDTLFINSGIKVALDTVLSDIVGPNNERLINDLRRIGIGVAGLYVNKSGKGNAGFDVRACLVDEDYSGYVHLSMAYTKELIEDGQNIVYCGDKLTQMMLIPVFHTEYDEIDEDKYNDIMKNSKRGDLGFGSSDVKH